MLYNPSFSTQIIRAAIAEAGRKTERAVEGAINTVFKIPKSSLKTLLDAHSCGNNFSDANESDIVDRELKEEQKRKKRRGLRR